METALRFDPEAQEVWRGFARKHHELLGLEGMNVKLASHIGKYDGMLARLCVVWHCVEHPHGPLPPLVSADTVRRAGEFLHRFLLKHALAFYSDLIGISSDQDTLSSIAGYILAHRLTEITFRDIARGDRAMQRLDRREATRMLEQLEAFGWLWPGTPRRAPVWTVNPLVHERFAARAEAEAKRRAAVRAQIAEVAGHG